MLVGTRYFWNRISPTFHHVPRVIARLSLPLVIVILIGVALPVRAQTVALSNLHSFGATGDGAAPAGPLVLIADGSFVGTTSSGGANGTGCVYDVTTTGSVTILYSFSAIDTTMFTNSDGANPLYGVILGADGNYYGCTLNGGTSGNGTAFMLTPAGVFTTLHNFSSTDGANPVGLVPSSTAGTFYGVCESGGANLSGTIFSMTVTTGSGTVKASTAAIKTLYSFSALDTNGNNLDGADPQAVPIIAKDGNLYGTTLGGGNTEGTGAANGEAVGGTVWTYSLATTATAATAFKVLHTFSKLDANSFNADGTRPDAGLVQISDGSLIGSCEDGGVDGTGTVFDISTSGTPYTVLHSFGVFDPIALTNTDGIGPSAGVVQLTDGSIYGTCEAGGSAGIGTTFKIASPTTTPVFSVVYTFGSQSSSVIDGSDAEGNLIEGKDGNVYGTTGGGGTNFGGIVFQLPLNLPKPDPGLTVTGLSKSAVPAGSTGFTLTVTGTGFDSTAIADWQISGSSTQVLKTTYVNATTLMADVPTSLLGIDATLNVGIPETHTITVVNVDKNTGSVPSAPSMFTVNPVLTLPPALQTLSPMSVTAGSADTAITITGTRLFTGDTVTVNGTVLTPTTVTPTQLTVTVPASVLTKSQTLSVTVSSNAGASNALALAVSPVTTFAGGLQLISLPYDYTGVSLSSVFGYGNPKLAYWNAAAGAYAITPTAPADALRLGRGYWVRFPAATNVLLAGTRAAAGTSVTISLAKGWNMIGDPFTTTSNGTGIIVTDSKGVTYTFADAVTAGIINGTTYSYDLPSKQYVTETTGSLQPFTGYWIYARETCTLSVNGS